VDWVGYDEDVTAGGLIPDNGDGAPLHPVNPNKDYLVPQVLPGSAMQILAHPDATLMLSFPDESSTLSLACLDAYAGSTLIHIGELASSSTVASLPWGRSTCPDFQARLWTEWHRIADVPLPRWAHEGTSLTVWRRNQASDIIYADSDDEEEGGEEVDRFAYVPEDERLSRGPTYAPCVRGLCEGVRFVTLKPEYTVAKFGPGGGLDVAKSMLVGGAGPVFVAVTSEETSLVFPTPDDPPDADEADPGWRCLKVVGPMPFDLVGIMAGISTALKNKGVSLLAQSTYDTDYVLVKKEKLGEAVKALRFEGASIQE
jgi:hypothetical protein